MRSLLLLLLATCAPALGVAAQSGIYVDPVNGLDAVDRGSPAAPYRSLTFAVADSASAISPTFVLRPGTYGAASGEEFPVRLPDLCRVEIDSRVIAPDSRSVVLDPPQGGVAAFLFAPARTGFATLKGLSIRNGRLLDVVARGATSFPFVTVEDCAVRDLAAGSAPGACLDALVEGGAVLTLYVRGAELESYGEGCLAVDVAAGSACQLRFDRCRFEGGDAVLDLDGRLGGVGVATLRACEVLRGRTAGIRSQTDRGADLVIELEHVLVADCGHAPVTGSSGAALLAIDAGGGLFPRHEVFNSILVGNAADAPVGGLGCTFGTNLVEQADLANLGGNQLGTARFVDSSVGNYRLLPNSLAVDAADGSATTLFVDRDGEPRGWHGERPDLGPDEMHLHSVHLETDSALGSVWEFVVRTYPGAQFGLLVGQVAGAAPFGAGLPHLDGAVFAPGLGGFADVDGIGRASLPVPGDPALLGLALHWQPVVSVLPFWGANSLRTVLR